MIIGEFLSLSSLRIIGSGRIGDRYMMYVQEGSNILCTGGKQYLTPYNRNYL